MSSLDLTRDWLQTVLRPYPSRDLILSQVLEILKVRRTLAVKTDAFTFDTGQTALLLLLHGTLPISFRGATYHIPIHLWIPHEYPRAAPLAFVVPTKEMGVRKGREVDPSGRIKEDIVEQWWASWQDKSIDMLLKQLTSVFSAVPPVFARPPEQQQQQLQQAGPSTIRSPQIAAPRPTEPVVGQSGQPPPPPARPGYGLPQHPPEFLPQYKPAPNPPAQIYALQNSQHIRQASGQYPQSPSSASHPGPPQSPPVPQRPSQVPLRQSSQPPASPVGPMMPQRPYIHSPQFGQIYEPQPSMTPPRPGQPAGPPVHGSPITGYAPDPRYPLQSQHSSNGYQPSHPSQQQLPPQQVPMRQPNGHPAPDPQSPAQQIPPQQTRQQILDLMSAADDSGNPVVSSPASTTTAPPPLPPSKPPPPSLLHLHSILLPHLNATLHPLIGSLQADRQHLIERHEDLMSGEPAIKDEMARLEAVKNVCDAVERKLDDVVARGEERVMDLEQKGEVSVDEVVCGISIVHNQLIDLVAEDNAIEDTIYHMTRALDAERIDLDRFLKSIRSLGREQYMKRALIERILQGMGQTW